MTFVFRIDRMGGKVEIRGLAAGAENIHRFERTVRDVVDSSKLPLRITITDSGEEDRTDLPTKLRQIFTSEESITSILKDLKEKIVQQLIPKLQREGYEETAEAEANARTERREQEARNPNHPFHGGNPQPTAPYPRPGLLPDLARPPPQPVGDFPPPGFEDEYEINHPPRRGGGLVMPGRSPFNIGHDDLHPPGLGPNDPLRGSFIPGRGGFPAPGGSSGMHPTFDDPLFGGPGGGPFGSGQDGQYDPQAPPGARWDPLGPGGGPRFPGQGGGGHGGRGGNPFGGDII